MWAIIRSALIKAIKTEKAACYNNNYLKYI